MKNCKAEMFKLYCEELTLIGANPTLGFIDIMTIINDPIKIEAFIHKYARYGFLIGDYGESMEEVTCINIMHDTFYRGLRRGQYYIGSKKRAMYQDEY